MSGLHKLYDDNRDNPIRRCAINAASKDEAEILLYDAIGGWFGIDATQFIKDLKAIEAKTIHLRVNSPGGDVNAARAIQTAIAQHPAHVVAHVDGIAASAASFLILAADEIEATSGAFIMVHNPWLMTIGNEEDHRTAADLLAKYGEGIANDYARRTGKSIDDVRAWMAEETWFTADEARDAKLVDRVIETVAPANAWNLSAYKRTPETLLKKFTNVAASAAAILPTKESIMAEVQADAPKPEASETVEETPAAAVVQPAAESPVPKPQAAAPEPPAPPVPDPAAVLEQARADAYEHAGEIAGMCVLAGKAGMASGFIKARKSVADVAVELQNARAADTDTDQITSHVAAGAAGAADPYKPLAEQRAKDKGISFHAAYQQVVAENPKLYEQFLATRQAIPQK